MITSDLKIALDPVSFAREALGFLPDPWQAHVLHWTGTRILLNCARQSGKSITAAIIVLHRALHYPGSLILLVSPSLRQSSEGMRRIMTLLQRLKLKPKLVEDNKLSVSLGNGSRIVCLPSKEATIRGYSGVSLIVEDEASRVPDEVYLAIRPMIAVSSGRLILMSTPFGKRGHFYDEWSHGENWKRIEVKAMDCPRISPEFLEEERAALGDWWFRQEYLCEFVETVDQIFGHDLVSQAITVDIKPLFGGE